MSSVPTHRRLDPQPFRDWCEKRLMTDLAPHCDEVGSLAGRVTAEQLAERMGIDDRRLYAWREENVWLDRDRLEDALHRAGYSIEDIYPDLPPLPEEKPAHGGWGPEPGRGSLLSDENVLALHRLHIEGGVSIRELARRIYRKAGYASWEAAMHGIRRGFRRLGLEAQRRHPTELAIRPRLCVDQKSNGEPCEAFAVTGRDRCWPHENREIAKQRIAQANQARLEAMAA